MNGTYYVVRRIATGAHIGPAGVSRAPHLYDTPGKAAGIIKRMCGPHLYDVATVQLTEIKE